MDNSKWYSTLKTNLSGYNGKIRDPPKQMGSRQKVIRVTSSDTESVQFPLIRQADTAKMLQRFTTGIL